MAREFRAALNVRLKLPRFDKYEGMNMGWTDYAAIAALGISVLNLVIVSGLLSDIRGVTQSVDRQLVEIREITPRGLRPRS